MLATPDLKLLFPEFEVKITQKEGKLWIYDSIAKKNRLLTPEEWVRQHCLNYLTEHLNYPATNIQIERGHTIHQMARRTDIQVFANTGDIFLLVECKAPHIPLSDISFQQISQYQVKSRARFLLITNGLEHQIFEITQQQTIPLAKIPLYA